MTRVILILVTTLSSFVVLQTIEKDSPQSVYDHLDSLRGSITPERAWWDLTYYHLDLTVNSSERSLHGTNRIDYVVISENQVIQIDLQAPMKILSVAQEGKKLEFEQQGPVHFIRLLKQQEVGAINSLLVTFEGQPTEARDAPWDGGFTWSRDQRDRDFIATSCQGVGASLWWPCKDHMYDEPDSMLISVAVPRDLTAVSNGRLRKVEENEDHTKTYYWVVNNPINNYGVAINLGDYVTFAEQYEGEKGPLTLDYYVLRDHLSMAKKHFKEVPMMLKAFEYWFGPYPFYEDGFKLVEAPFLGMEHQSAVAYGNHFQKGYGGADPSATGWGLLWDYVIVHEGGHEWFANNITYRDIADMWVHEGFTTYSEGLYTEYHYGKEAGADYLRGLRIEIDNRDTIIGDYDVNNEGDGDMYFKGANMLHTIRQVIDNDELWRSILRGLNEKFYHQTVTTRQIEEYISQQAGKNLTYVFDQYLRHKALPVFEYTFKEQLLMYRWSGAINGFDMPLKVWMDDESYWLEPTTEWQFLSTHKNSNLVVDPDFYVATMNLK